MTLADLNLDADTYQVAAALVQECPWVRFTSGRRTIADQARAMAENVAIRRSWIVGDSRHRPVYKTSLVSMALNQWLRDNKEAVSEDAIAAGFAVVLARYADADLAKLSKHLAGRAFDVQPVGDEPGEKILETLRRFAKDINGTFLEEEGGLVRWHFQL